VRTVAIPVPVIPELEAQIQLIGDLGPDSLVFPANKSTDGMRPFHTERSAGSGGRRLRTSKDCRKVCASMTCARPGHTLAATTGASTRELMARMGHASPPAALIYQHASANRDRAIAVRSRRVSLPAPLVPSALLRLPEVILDGDWQPFVCPRGGFSGRLVGRGLRSRRDPGPLTSHRRVTVSQVQLR
jgi:hypothetical protein